MVSAPVPRRTAALLLGAAVLAPPSVTAAHAAPPSAPLTVTDVVGRSVRLPGPARRIVLLDAKDVLSMAVLDPNPSRRIAGWAAVDTLDSDLLRRQYETRTDGTTIPVVGGQTADTLSLERILSLEPDLVVATARMEPALGEGVLTRRLEDAGIPVVFSNAAANDPHADAGAGETPDAPFHALAHTIGLWGAVLGRPAQADSFLAFVNVHRAEVRRRVEGLPPIKAYLEVQSTYDDCCWAAGKHIWGDLLTLAGGRTLSVIESTWYAKVAPEQLMVEAPAVYIASGGAFGAGMRPGIAPGLDPAPAREGLHRLTGRTGFDILPAVRDGRVHGVWTGLLSLPPLNILFLEVVARWLHPEACAGLDPTATLDALNRRFLAKPLPGPCWLTLSP